MIDLRKGECLATMKAMAEAGEQVDSVVTDPPYHLTAGKKGGTGEASVNLNSPYGRSRITTGFMGQKWDGGDIAMNPETWALAYDVLKPGGHMLVFGGTRTFHRVAVAIEDAGFEIRDTCMWLYGSGFPKSHSVALALDKMAGHENRSRAFNYKGGGDRADEFANNGRERAGQYQPKTDAAKQWEGWGTALKPAWEPIIVARKPLSEKSVAANVLAHGTGAINVDGCRVGVGEGGTRDGEATAEKRYSADGSTNYAMTPGPRGGAANGRWPANVMHDGLDEEWARYFYSSKAGKSDRAGSKHPTVKPVNLMAYLCRLVTPPGGTVLDPFAGSGTTGQAALDEGFRVVLCEREDEYIADIERRFGLAADPTEEDIFG